MASPRTLLLVGVFLALAFLSSDVEAKKKKKKPPVLTFGVIGDWGWGKDGDYYTSGPTAAVNSLTQRTVAGALGYQCARKKCDFVISTGDNFYDLGIDALKREADPQWVTSFSNVYGQYDSLISIPFYASLGNHDYGVSNYSAGNKSAMHSIYPQVEYTHYDPLGIWKMPSRYYTVNPAPKNRIPSTLTVIDSSPFLTDYCTTGSGGKYNSTELLEFCKTPYRNAQLSWAASSLATARSLQQWSIMVGHHPLWGVKPGTYPGYSDAWAPVINNPALSPDIWFNGHEHITAHFKFPGNSRTEFFSIGSSGSWEVGDGVLGAASQAFQTANNAWDFIQGLPSFAIVRLTRTSAVISVYTANLTVSRYEPFQVVYRKTIFKSPASPPPPSPPPSPPPRPPSPPPPPRPPPSPPPNPPPSPPPPSPPPPE